MRRIFLIAAAALAMICASRAQCADWNKGIWHEPQVRYLLADMQLGGLRVAHGASSEAPTQSLCLFNSRNHLNFRP